MFDRALFLLLAASSVTNLSISASRLGPSGSHPSHVRARSPLVCALVPSSTAACAVMDSAASASISLTADDLMSPLAAAKSAILRATWPKG